MHPRPHTMPMPWKTQIGHPMHNRSPNPIQTPIIPSLITTIQFIKSSYCHDKFPNQALKDEHTEYDPLINTLHNNGWKVNPLITIMAGVWGGIHDSYAIRKLTNLKLPKYNIKTLVKNIHQNAIKYLTCLVMNNRNYTTNKLPAFLPHNIWWWFCYRIPPSEKEA